MIKLYIKISFAAFVWLFMLASGLYGVSIEYVNSTLWGQMNDIVVSGDYAYGSFVNGLGIFDISDKTNPKLISQLYVPGNGEKLAIKDDYIYLCDGYSGVRVISIKNKNKPLLITTCNLPRFSRSIFLVDDYAYIICDGIHVLDLTDPSKPNQVSLNKVPETQLPGYIPNNRYLFIPFGREGIKILDITDPGNPSITGTIIAGGWVYDTNRDNSLLYCAVSSQFDSAGIQVFDISNQPKPVSLSFTKIGGHSFAVVKNGRFVYATESVHGGFSNLAVIDVSNPSNPIKYQVPDTIFNTYRAVISDGYLFLAGNEYQPGGFFIYNIADAAHPKMIGSYKTNQISDIFSTGRYCYIANGYYGGFKIIEIDSLNNMKTIGSYNAPHGSDAIAVKGDYAFITSYPGMTVLNINDPANPKSIGKYDFFNTCNRLFINGNYAYLPDVMSINIVNISNPDNPQLIGNYDQPKGEYFGSFFDIVTQGNYAYIADYDSGLNILDISNLANPVIISRFISEKGYIKICLSYNLVFMLNENTGVEIIDIKNPNQPILISTYNGVFRPTDLFVSDNYLYIVDGGGLQLLDITDITKPTKIADFPTHCQATRVNVVGDKIFVATEAALFLLKLVP